MIEKIRFALVGCGRIGSRHAEHINNVGILKAVCDIKRTKRLEFGRQYKVPAYFSIDELLRCESEIDVVSICTPNGFHAEHSIMALRAGFHVLCEKPMALEVDDCQRMISQAQKANRNLFVVKQNRFNPPVVKVKQLIDEGRLGRIFSVQLNCFWNRNLDYYRSSDWKGDKDLDGGTLFTQFSHFIDLLYWLIGDVEEVCAMKGNFAHIGAIQFEDTGVVILRFSGGAIGTIHYTVNAYLKNMEGSITIFGEKGTVKIGGQYLNELDYQAIENYEIKGLPKGNSPNDYGNYVGSMSNHDKVYENVVDVLTKGGDIVADGMAGLKTVEIINKIYLYGRGD